MPQIDYVEVGTGSVPKRSSGDYDNVKIYISTVVVRDPGNNAIISKDYVIKYSTENINYLAKKISSNDRDIVIGLIEGEKAIDSGRRYPNRDNPANTTGRDFYPAVLDITN